MRGLPGPGNSPEIGSGDNSPLGMEIDVAFSKQMLETWYYESRRSLDEAPHEPSFPPVGLIVGEADPRQRICLSDFLEDGLILGMVKFLLLFRRPAE